MGILSRRRPYDQIYDEHVFYFSLKSISHLVEQHGLEVIDVRSLGVHGGSMRYVIGHKGARVASESVAALRATEERLGLHRPETYAQLRSNIERSRDELMEQLRQLKAQGKSLTPAITE